MHASGFTNAPLTRLLVVLTISLAFLASLTATKPYLPLAIRPHLLDYHQYWRLLTWPLAYTNSTEVLFAGMTFYQLRVIERLWGTRKFGVCQHNTPTTTKHPVYLCSNIESNDASKNLRLTGRSAVLPHNHSPLHNPPPTPAPHPPAAPLFQQDKLPPLRPHLPRLRPASTIPLRHPVDIQVPRHHISDHIRDFVVEQGDFLCPADATGAEPVAWISYCGGRGLDRGVCVSKGDFARGSEVESADVGGGWE